MIKYTVVECSTLNSLCENVKWKIKEGWIPQGGVSAYSCNITIRPCYCQAMTKTDPKQSTGPR